MKVKYPRYTREQDLRCKLTDEQIRKIPVLYYQLGLSMRKIGKKFGVSGNTIRYWLLPPEQRKALVQRMHRLWPGRRMTREEERRYKKRKSQLMEKPLKLWQHIQQKEYRDKNKEELKQYRKKNGKKIRQRNKEYREKNKERIRKRKKEYRERNWERIRRQERQRYKEYYERNREKVRQRNKGYYEKNKERIRQQLAEYREKNREKINQYAAEYRERNKEKITFT